MGKKMSVPWWPGTEFSTQPLRGHYLKLRIVVIRSDQVSCVFSYSWFHD